MSNGEVKVTRPGVIKKFFSSQGVNPNMTYSEPNHDELKELVAEDKAGYIEMAELCAQELGLELPAK